MPTLDLNRLMMEATQMTRSGDLQGAMAAIQSAMRGAGVEAGTRAEPPQNGGQYAAEAGEIIDVEMHEIADTAKHESGQRDAPQSVPQQTRPAADTGFTAGHYADGSTRRDYKLYIPPAAGTRPLPLVVMLHGCTQDPDDFAAGTQMNDAGLAHDFFVLYPAQSQRANPQRCWNWFKHNHQVRGRGEPAMLAGMTRQIMAKYAIDPERVYIAGLSAGGAMAAIMGEAYPDLYAAVGVHSGLASGAAADLPSALAAMKGGGMVSHGAASGVPTIVFHGDADATVHHGNGQQVIKAAVGTGSTMKDKRLGGGEQRAYTRHVHRGADGRAMAEYWLVHGAPHAWSGGSRRGSYTDERGPDATQEMVRFFLEHPRRPKN